MTAAGRRLDAWLPGAVAAALAASFLLLRLGRGESALAALVLAAAFAAGLWALIDLEGFVLLPLLGAMVFPQAIVHPAGALVAAADLLLVVALGAWLVRGAVSSGPIVRLRGNPILVPSLLFALVTALSLAWSSHTGTTVKAAVQTLEIVVVLPLVFASVPTSLERMRRALAVFVAVTCGLAFVTVAYSAPRELRGVFEPQYLPGLHKNAVGSFLGVGLVLAFALALDRPRRSRRVYAIACAIEGLGLLATISRGAIMGALCGILVVSLLLRRSRIVTVALVLAGALAFAFAVQTQLDARTKALGGFNTNAVRVLSYEGGIRKIQQHPVLGTGAGTYWDDIPQLQIGLADPNNLFLLTWAELGLAGMAALLFLLWRYARTVARARRLPEPARLVALAAGGSALSLFVHFQVDSTWTRGTASICFALVGLAVAATRLGRAAPPDPVDLSLRPPPEDGRMRILHVVSSDAYAGIERHVLRLARGLASRGVDVTLACPPGSSRLRTEAVRAGVRVVPPPGETRSGWLSDLDRWVRATPDVIHVHDGAAAVAGWQLAGRGSSRLVRTQHFVRTASSERGGWRRTASLALHRALNAEVDALVAVSESAGAAAESRREVQAAKVAVIPPGIDLPSEENVERALEARRAADHPVVAFVGRLEREKSVDLLLCAMPIVLRHVPSCRLVVAGAGSRGPELRQLAQRLRLGRKVHFAGEVADAGEVLAGAHLVVSPSTGEGFGLAVAEALAWALPVVGIASGGTAELVEDGETGLLVEAPEPAELAAAIVRLAADRELAEELGREARRRAIATLGADRTTDLTLALYERLV